MNQESHRPPGISDELRPYVDAPEAVGIDAVAERLERDRPVPRAGFRAELHARLVELSTKRTSYRPARLRRLIAAYGVAGAACLAIAAIGLTGAGPLGA